MNMINKAKDQKSAGAANHLANERTFLAWIRTSLALMGFGFVIVKFTLFINQITTALGEKNVIPVKGYSATIGIIMVVMGAIMATLAYLRYLNIEKQLKDNSYFPSGWLSGVVTLVIVIASILLAIYLLPNVK